MIRPSSILKRASGLFALVALAAIVGGLMLVRTDNAFANPATVTVGQTNGGGATGVNQFNAAAVSIFTNETVTWNSALDNRSHDVSSYAETVPGTPDWQSPQLRSGTANTQFVRTFAANGTFTYYCSLHASRADAAPAVIDANIAGGLMVGKVTVTAPPPDLTAPTTSAVAATPNPTNGAASITLTATITDSGTPLGTITSAEYRIDAGAPAAMSAVDGAFNGSTENVTANVSLAGLADGAHTVEVRGTDNSGNASAWVALAGGLSKTPPPAGAVQATVTVLAGGLSNTPANIPFGNVTQNGSNQIVPAAALVWNALDARGSGAGWNVSLTSTDFTGAGTIGVANFKVQQLASKIITVSGNTAPSSQVLTFQPLGATPLKLLSAALNQGMGSYDYTPDFQLTVPASAVAGAYTANVTVAINSGP